MAELQLEDMPMDVIRAIIAPLELRDRLLLRNVSRRLREVVDEAPFTFDFIRIYKDENGIFFTYPGFALAYTGVRHCKIWIGNGRHLRRHRRTPTQVALEYFTRLLSHKSKSINVLDIHVTGDDSEQFLIDLLICMQTIEWQRGCSINVRTVSLQARVFSLAMQHIFESFRLDSLNEVILTILDGMPVTTLEEIKIWRQIQSFRFFGPGLTGLANSPTLSSLTDIFICGVISSQEAMDILTCLINNTHFHKMELIVDFASMFHPAEFARILGVPLANPFQLHHRLQMPDAQEDMEITY
uniref:F-box domain-containing protein n=1 Tax=Caenorhabditis tropicalis TaxID=1561998 RepID=A0A1I7U5L9_9PELO